MLLLPLSPFFDSFHFSSMDTSILNSGSDNSYPDWLSGMRTEREGEESKREVAVW